RLVVGHEHERDPDLLLEGLQLETELLSDLRVQRADRLVEQQQRGSQHERPRERDALLLATRELLGATSAEALGLDQLGRLLYPAAGLVLRDLVAAKTERDVVVDVEVGEQRVVLEHRVDVSLVWRHRGDVLAVEQDLAGGRALEAGDHPQRRRLAAARRTE